MAKGKKSNNWFPLLITLIAAAAAAFLELVTENVITSHTKKKGTKRTPKN